jgi:hypothetical protein
MSNDLQIITQTPNQLVVHSPTSVFSFITFILVLGTLGMSLFVYFTASPGGSLFWKKFILWLGAFSALIAVGIAVWSHTLSLSRADGSGTVENKFAGVTYSTQHVPLADMKRAVLESARPGTRIAIVLQNGDEVFPFGKAYNPKPSQYKVIDLINDFVDPSHVKQLDDMDEHFRKLDEREAAEAAKKNGSPQ